MAAGELQLRADPVGRGHEDGLAPARHVELEQASEAADAAEDLGAVGARDERRDRLDGTVGRLQRDPDCSVGQAAHCVAWTTASTDLPAVCSSRGTGMGYSPSKHARHSEERGRLVVRISASRSR